MKRHLAVPGLLSLCLIAAGTLLGGPGFDVAATRSFLQQLGYSTQGGTVTPQWLKDGTRFWFTEGEPLQAVWLVDPAAAELKRPLLDVARARAAFGRAAGMEGAAFTVAAYDETAGVVTLALAGDTSSWTLRLADYTGSPLPNPSAAGAAEAEWRKVGFARDMFPISYRVRERRSPEGRWIATCVDHDVAFRSTATGQVTRVTTTGTETVPWYFANDIMEPSGSPWSPDGTRFALRTHDMTAVPGFPIVDWLAQNPTVNLFRYWGKVGQPLAVTTFHVFDLIAQKLTPVELGGDGNHFAVFLDWSPDGKEIWFYRASRVFRTVDLGAADAATGKARVVLTETRQDGFVEFPWNGVKNLEWVDDQGDTFLWYSDREGWPHWYRYRRDGTLLNPVTRGAWHAEGIEKVDAKGSRLYLMGASDAAHPYDAHLLEVPLAGGEPRVLTRERGSRRVMFSPSGAYFLETHSHSDRPHRTDLVRVSDGKVVGTLAAARIDRDFRGAWPPAEEFVVRAADGVTDMHGVILKPWNFDPSKKYPVIERIYGAMQALSAPRGWFGGNGAPRLGSEYNHMLAWFCRQGFVVVALDAPGTPERGRTYQMRPYGSWPQGVIADHVAGLKQLAASHPWLDLDRLGIEGNSSGGYMATRALIEAPDFYRAASASVPDTDFFDSVSWLEFMTGSPRENPEAYAIGTNLDKAGKIKAPLLITAGTSDVNVTFSSNMKLMDALARAGVPYEYVLFPNTDHQHQGRGDRYAYAVTRIAEFFPRHLGQQP